MVKLTSACRGLGRVAPYLALVGKERLFMRLGALEWLDDRRGQGGIAEIPVGAPMVVTVEPCLKPLLQFRDGDMLLGVDFLVFEASP